MVETKVAWKVAHSAEI
jgi:hypothetical protein